MTIPRQIRIIPQAEALAIAIFSANKKLATAFVKDSSDLDLLADQIKFFAPSLKILKFPAWDVLHYDRVSPSAAIIYERLSTLSKLLEFNQDHSVLVLTTPSAVARRTLPKAFLKKTVVTMKVGSNFSHELLIELLVELGYLRLSNAVNTGEFAVRGSIIDVVIKNDNTGYRLDFFGERLEAIKIFSTEDQSSIAKAIELTITPTSEVILNAQTVEIFKGNYLSRFGVRNDVLLEAISHSKKYSGMENWLPIFYNSQSSFFDYLPDYTEIIVYENIGAPFKEMLQEAQNAFSFKVQQSKVNTSALKKMKVEAQNLLAVNELFMNFDDFSLAINKFKNHEFSFFSNSHDALSLEGSIPQDYGFIENIKAIAQAQKISIFSLLHDYVRSAIDERYLVTSYSKGSLERLKNVLNDHEVKYQFVDCFESLDQIKPKTLAIAICPLEEGFKFQNYSFFSERDIFGERLSKLLKVKKFSGNLLSELNAFNEGDIIVHIEHGIGKFMGLETLVIERIKHDFVKIIYADNDKLFLPVENLELITRYGGGDEIMLDKLGGVAWQLRKAKLKNKIKIAAEALLKIAAQRAQISVPPIAAFADLYLEFCDKFPYVETEDQLAAIEAVADDLLSGKPMDRLVCGDVGFGKTEVALRAAFIMVANPVPKQVALLVPTTLLARQHYKTFMERFAGFAFRIKQLSKFTTAREIKESKEALKAGAVDIIIGTHGLLAKTIEFKDLGLIIIDEEQHFGVGQKERLKELKSNCHVLTLSATPIPRTLQMSLAGIKELSLIATPPPNRLPVNTSVLPFDELMIREAILREFYRGGRVFLVTPRISYIESLSKLIEEIVPEIKAVVAHGQLGPAQLDSIMNDFYDGKFQVLISTTIVESGLDIPMANTIIVDRADMFGLSQLYQIRGRVGRSNIQAYAYFMYHTSKKLNDLAEKRLNVIQSLNTLGAGFSVAAQDMDIRGYGNLVGEEQSGHVKEVGVELYQHMLEEAVAALRTKIVEVGHDWSPVINVGISVQIPDSYIPDVSLRLNLYRRIAALNVPEEVEALAAEMIDRFGSLPLEVEYLLSIVKLKQLCKNANIERIDQGEKGLLISFRNKTPKYPSAVIDLVASSAGVIKIRPDEKLFVNKVYSVEKERIKHIEKLLQNLSL